MSKNIFVTGTGTDVGKTYVTALLVKKLAGGARAAYYKAAISGNKRDKNGKLLPGDALWVKKVSGITQPTDEMCPYVYENAYSPHLACRIEGNPPKMDKICEGFYNLCPQYDFVTVEGSGGILCPIGYDDERIQLEDIVKKLNLASLLVADAGLGTINQVVLTAEYMKNRGLPLKGIIFNNYHPGNIMEEDNKFMCEQMTGLKVLACVQPGAEDIGLSFQELEALYE